MERDVELEKTRFDSDSDFLATDGSVGDIRVVVKARDVEDGPIERHCLSGCRTTRPDEVRANVKGIVQEEDSMRPATGLARRRLAI